MLFKLFKSNHPYVIFLIPFLGVALWIPSLFHEININQPINQSAYTLAYQWLTKPISPYPQLSASIGLLFLILQAYILIRLNFKHIFIEQKTYIPSILFIIYGSAMLSYQQLHPALINNFFLIWSLDKALIMDKERNSIKRYFESGFFLGLGALIYPNIYVFIILIWLTLIILHQSKWRDWSAVLFGFFTPVLIYWSILFLNSKQDQSYANFQKIIFKTTTLPSFSTYAYIPLIVISSLFIIGMLISMRYVGIKKISTRKYYNFFFWFLLTTLAIIYFHPAIGLELIYMLSIPLAFLSTLFYTEVRNWWVKEIFFTLTILSAIALIWIH